jgi:hypothetical protein
VEDRETRREGKSQVWFENIMAKSSPNNTEKMTWHRFRGARKPHREIYVKTTEY